jgi:hypothetical protein
MGVQKLKNKILIALMCIILVVALDIGTAFLLPYPAVMFLIGMVYGFLGMNLYLKLTQ